MVTGCLAERYVDERTTDDVRAWKVVAQRGEWVKVPLLVGTPEEGRFDAEIVGNAEDGVFSWKQAIRSRQAVCTANLHDTGAFVIFKKQRTLNTSRRDHHTLRPNFDIAFIEDI